MQHQPINSDLLAQIDAAFDRLGPYVTIDRQPGRDGRGKLWTIHTRCAGAVGMGQGDSLGEALRDLHAITPAKARA